MNSNNMESIKENIVKMLDGMSDIAYQLDLYEDDFKNKMSEKSRAKAYKLCCNTMYDVNEQVSATYSKVQGLGKKLMNIVDSYIDLD